MSKDYDVIIVGAGGAGMMCAIEAAKRGRKTLVVDHADKVGKKILISGGGRCNFTNTGITADRYISGNKHFVKSAFGQYTAQDFIDMVDAAGISYHEKKLGQLFCDDSAQQIIDMLMGHMEKAGVDLQLNATIKSYKKGENDEFVLFTSEGVFAAPKLVIATGGLSIPKMGATNFGYKFAEYFDLKVTGLEPGLVPFTLNPQDIELYSQLSGTAIDAEVSCGKKKFRENILITHRGISGPAILQISSYWKAGEEIKIDLLPDVNLLEMLKERRNKTPKQELKTLLNEFFTKKFVQTLVDANLVPAKTLADLSNKDIQSVDQFFSHFTLKPHGTEGYRKAEVTIGGVATSELDSRTLECKKVPNLHFIGEVVDVTGWLGGYNFQWAWSSGYAAGQVV